MRNGCTSAVMEERERAVYHVYFIVAKLKIVSGRACNGWPSRKYKQEDIQFALKILLLMVSYQV